MDTKKFSTFSYKLVQISPIMILVMIPYISSTGYPPTTQGIMGHVQVANSNQATVAYRNVDLHLKDSV